MRVAVFRPIVNTGNDADRTDRIIHLLATHYHPDIPCRSLYGYTFEEALNPAGAVAIAPIMQGPNKPVNDLSRGCVVTDMVNTVAITAIQGQAEKGLIS